jgi:pimeloyl-[acyl-carrier protein] methyl ester esterase
MSRLHVSKFVQADHAPVLVLLHGWSSSSKIWQTCIAELSKEFQVWCVDLPGHGQSLDVEWDESVEQGLQLLAEALPSRCSLIGWSLGGLLAQLYVQQYPQNVQNLMLIASTPKFVASHNWAYGMPQDKFVNFLQQFDRFPQSTIKQFMVLQALHSLSSKRIIVALDEAVSKQHLHKLRWGLRWLEDIDLRETVLPNHVVTQFLQGENDQVCQVQAAEHTVKIWNQISLCKVARAGHLPFLSHPQVFMTQVQLMKNNIEKYSC